MDEYYYLTISRDLALHGVFTNGTYKRGPFGRTEGPADFGDEDAKSAKPGRFFAPVYPILVYAIGKIDKRLEASVRCQVRYHSDPRAANCPRDFRTLTAVQVMLWAVALLAIFQLALMLSRSEVVAWLAMLIAIGTGEPGYYVRTYLSENTTVPAFLIFMHFGVRSVMSRRKSDIALAGVTLAFAALSRPAYVYLIYLLAGLAVLAALLLRHRDRAPMLSEAGVYVGASFAVLVPWMLRNYVQFGDFSLSKGYAEVILTQRMSYNQMSMAEWLVAWIYWLPDFGDDLAARLFPRALWERLGWSHPRNYYLDGAGEGAFVRLILAQAPEDRDVFPLLLKSYLLGDLGKHVLVSLPLTMRGLGVAKYLSIAGVALLCPVTRRLYADGRLMPFLAMLLPPLLMAALHGFVSVNIERYNLPMIAVYAFAIAVMITEWGQRLWQARPARL